MKKNLISLLLLLLVAMSIGCEEDYSPQKEPASAGKNEEKSENTDIDCEEGSDVVFYDISDFKDYINDTENQTFGAYFDADKYINFDSVIPNSEISLITVDGRNSSITNYGYQTEEHRKKGLTVQFIWSVSSTASSEKSCYPDYPIFDDVTKLSNSDDGEYLLQIDQYVMLVSIYNHQISGFYLNLGNWQLRVYYLNDIYDQGHKRTPSISAFSDAFSDNKSAVQMLDRIAALIPTET